MIVIKNSEVQIDTAKLENFREQYDQLNIFICPQLFSDSLQLLIKNKLTNTPYILKTDKKENGDIISQEYSIPHDAIITRILNFYLNQDAVINSVQKICNLPSIHSFKGRIYKFEPDEFSFDNWHDDRTDDSRILGLSINLSEAPYEGGEFKIRNKRNKEISANVKHENWGAAHFFKIDPNLEHMVSKIKGTAPRVAFAGWFMKEPFFIPKPSL